jgi:hypothetical protein
MRKLIFVVAALLSVSGLSYADLMVKLDGTLDSMTQDVYIIRTPQNDLYYIKRSALSPEDEKQVHEVGKKIALRVNSKAVINVRKSKD